MDIIYKQGKEGQAGWENGKKIGKSEKPQSDVSKEIQAVMFVPANQEGEIAGGGRQSYGGNPAKESEISREGGSQGHFLPK